MLLSGNAVEMPWVSRVPAIVQGWYLGSMGGKDVYKRQTPPFILMGMNWEHAPMDTSRLVMI